MHETLGGADGGLAGCVRRQIGGCAPGVQRAQQGALFGLVATHALEDVVQGLDGLGDVGALVEHDTFGTHTQASIRNLGA